MKAKFKKIVAALLSAMMVLTMCVATNVHAAEPTGNLNITSVEPLNGRTFNVYQLFNLTTNGQTDETTKFNYTQYDSTVTDAIKDILVDSFSKDAETLTDVDEIVAAIGTLKGDDIQKFAKLVSKQVSTIKETITVPAGGVAVNKKTVNVPYGYYVIVEKTEYTDEDKNKPTISLAMLKTVYKAENDVKVKSELPDVKKELVDSTSTNPKGSDYQVGDTVSFKVTGTAPRTAVLNTYDTYEYIFTDTLSAGLTLDKDSFTVSMNGTPITEGFVIDKEANPFTITFADLKKVANIKGADDAAKNVITVEYTATLNNKSLVTDPDTNKVNIKYSNNPDASTKGQSKDDVVYVYNFGLEVTKVDGTTKEALKGAEFRLEDANGHVLVAKENAAGDYTVQKFDSTTENATVLKTTEDGKLVVSGLEDGTYKLFETKAPAGYNVLKEPVTITIESTYKEDGTLNAHTATVGTDTDGNGTFEFDVENNSGTLLPETGGMGTTILYLVGILAMAGGVCYFVMERRKAQQR